MLKAAKITVKSKQRVILPQSDDEDIKDSALEEPVVTVVESDGTLELKDGVYTIEYTESPVTGLVDCVTDLSFSENEKKRVTMFRAGPVKTALMFCEGQRYISVYDTGFASFEVSIVTEKCDNDVDEYGGDIFITYTVEIRGSEAEHTELHVSVRPI